MRASCSVRENRVLPAALCITFFVATGLSQPVCSLSNSKILPDRFFE